MQEEHGAEVEYSRVSVQTFFRNPGLIKYFVVGIEQQPVTDPSETEPSQNPDPTERETSQHPFDQVRPHSEPSITSRPPLPTAFERVTGWRAVVEGLGSVPDLFKAAQGVGEVGILCKPHSLKLEIKSSKEKNLLVSHLNPQVK